MYENIISSKEHSKKQINYEKPKENAQFYLKDVKNFLSLRKAALHVNLRKQLTNLQMSNKMKL